MPAIDGIRANSIVSTGHNVFPLNFHLQELVAILTSTVMNGDSVELSGVCVGTGVLR